MVKAVWVHKSEIDQAPIAHAMLEPVGEQAKGYGPGVLRTFMVHNGRMFTANTKASEGYYYDLFDWEQHPTYPWLRIGRAKNGNGPAE